MCGGEEDGDLLMFVPDHLRVSHRNPQAGMGLRKNPGSLAWPLPCTLSNHLVTCTQLSSCLLSLGECHLL